ncbi:MAG TPA: hypothetical protein VGI30_07835 [Caulobacteraceae bacterium]|jgi:hypothetical protein
MPLAIAVVAAAAVGAGASIYEANKASSTAENVANQDNTLQAQIYAKNSANEQPYITSGNTAETELNGFLGLGGDPAATQKAFQTYLNSTGYQFDLNQGLDAVATSKAASGLLGSGSLVTALDQYGTGLAQQFGQQYVGNLMDETKVGANSANALAQSGQAYVNAANSNSNSAATVSEGADIATGNAINAFLKQAIGGVGQGGTSYPGGGGPNAFAPGIGG